MPTITLDETTMVKFIVRFYDHDMNPVYSEPRRYVDTGAKSPRHNAEQLVHVAANRMGDNWFGYADVTAIIHEPCSNVVAAERVFAFSVSDYGRDRWGLRNAERKVRSI